MTTLLEFKEIVKKVYSKYEVFITPVAKFLLALVTLLMINGRLGYMEAVDNSGVVLIVSLLCSFLPTGFVLVFGALFILLHFYALAIEVALVGFCVFLVMALLFLRFVPKDSMKTILTMICFHWNIPYVMPVCAGLAGTPSSAVSVGCGVVLHYMVNFVSNNATVISGMEEAEYTARIRMIIDYIIGNRAMFVVVIAFAITIITVYIIRRMAVAYNWGIAIVAGALVDAVVLLVGDLMYNTNVSIGGVLLGSLLAVAVGMVLHFFIFSVDYSRTEKLQFEDDEYYYYVKAVPKLTVATPEKTVKKNNVRHNGSGIVKSVGGTSLTRMPSGRTVTAERTGNPNRSAQYDRVQSGRGYSANRTVMDNEEEAQDPFLDDYEEL